MGDETLWRWVRARWQIVESDAVPAVPAERGRAVGQPERWDVADSPQEDVREQRSWIHPDRLEVAARWAAGGFTVLLSLLLFFGIKDGVLDQALRLNPLPALCVVVLLGCGLLAALFAPAIDTALRLRLWAVLAAIGLMMLIAALYFPNVGPVEPPEENGWADALWVLGWIALGFGVIAALALPAFLALRAQIEKKESGRGRWTASSLGAVLILISAIALLATQMTVQFGLTMALALAFLVAIAWAFAKRQPIAAGAAVIILGVTATSLGLYGAAKLSVDSKMLAVEPTVSAALATYQDEPAVVIRAAASKLRGKDLRVMVTGRPRLDMQQPPDAAEVEADGASTAIRHIWTSVLQPDGLDSIDEEINVPVSPARWQRIYVRHCLLSDAPLQPGDEPACVDGDDGTTVLRMDNVRRGMELTGHITAESADMLQVTLDGLAIAPGTRIVAEVCRVGTGKMPTPLAVATLAPDDNGALAWTPRVPAGADGDQLILLYRVCRPGMVCPEDMTELARYTLP